MNVFELDKYKYDKNDYIFYGETLKILETAVMFLNNKVSSLNLSFVSNNVRNPIEYYKIRIKKSDSMIEKLNRKGYPIDINSAMNLVHDAVGLRIVCTFIDDVYRIVEIIKDEKNIEVIKEKDYIHNPKANGYRSYHIIIKINIEVDGEIHNVFAEVQIRTIAMDCWASLEHQLKYKQKINHQEMLTLELKKCADEMASTDVNLQTIRDLIVESD